MIGTMKRISPISSRAFWNATLNAYLHCAQCCFVIIDRKASVQFSCETESGPDGANTTVTPLHCALVRRKSQQIRERLHSKLKLSVVPSGKQRRGMADWVITMSSQSGVHAADRTYLYLAEFLHRVHNEYACAISLANRVAGRSAHEETKTALAQIINRLHALAASHQMLRPPLTTSSADLSANLIQLCQAMILSDLADRDIELHLVVTESVILNAKRCWRAELIISELITNASRHAFSSQAGHISVAVETTAQQIICRVSDDGSPTATLKRGLGSELIDALAADLDGYVERIHNASGTTITLFFPQDRDEPATEQVNHAYG